MPYTRPTNNNPRPNRPNTPNRPNNISKPQRKKGCGCKK